MIPAGTEDANRSARGAPVSSREHEDVRTGRSSLAGGLEGDGPGAAQLPAQHGGGQSRARHRARPVEYGGTRSRKPCEIDLWLRLLQSELLSDERASDGAG